MNYDANELNLMFGDDPEIFEEILNDFVETKDEMLSQISEAISTKSGDQLEITAHTLKGVLATFCSLKGKEIAQNLERKGKHSEFDNVDEMYAQLVIEVDSLISNLNGHNFQSAA